MSTDVRSDPAAVAAAEQERHVHPKGSNGSGPAESALDRVRKRRAQLQQRNRINLIVPGYKDNDVGLWMRPLSWEELRAIGEETNRRTAAGQERAELYDKVDTIVKATVAVLIKDDAYEGRPSRTGPEGWKPLHEFEETRSDRPITFDQRLVEALAVDLTLEEGEAESQAACRALFENDWALSGFHDVYMLWRSGMDLGTDDELAGESERTP